MHNILGNYFYFKYPYKNYDKLLEKLETVKPKENVDWSWGNQCSLHKEAFLATDFSEILLQPMEYFALELGVGLDIDVLDPWLNQYKRKDFQEIHNHPDCDLSIVVFLNDGENFGEFYFWDPSHTQFNRLWYPILEKMGRGSIWIPEVKSGDVIVFPSHMMHGVTPHKSDETRKTFAYNVVLKNVY